METTAELDLLYIDERALQKEKIELVKAQTNLNKFVTEAEKVLGQLDNDQKIQLKTEGMKFVDSEVRKLFQFPKATDQFNMESQGIDLARVKAIPTNWGQYQFDMNDKGEFIASEDQKAFDRHHRYADTDKRIKALALAESVVQLFEEAASEGHVRGEHLAGVAASLKSIVKVDGDPRFSTARLVVDKRTISVIR